MRGVSPHPLIPLEHYNCRARITKFQKTPTAQLVSSSGINILACSGFGSVLSLSFPLYPTPKEEQAPLRPRFFLPSAAGVVSFSFHHKHYCPGPSSPQDLQGGMRFPFSVQIQRRLASPEQQESLSWNRALGTNRLQFCLEGLSFGSPRHRWQLA